jgi:peptidoglycan/LPS O-acetylase OafA/YrhL
LVVVGGRGTRKLIFRLPQAEMNYKHSIENFRGLAILFVMLTHIGSIQGQLPLGRLIHFVIGDATTWFVFISAYLFRYVELKRFNYLSYLGKKFRYVLLPYLILSVPALLVAIWAGKPARHGLSDAGYIGWVLVTGGQVVGPMWFVPMIALFFLVSPLFLKITNTAWGWAIVLAWLLFSVLSGRPYSNSNPALSFLHFGGFYALGIIAADSPTRISQLSRRAAVGMTLVCLAVFLMAFDIFLHEPPSEMLTFGEKIGNFNAMQVGKLALLGIVFVVFEKYLNRPVLWLEKLAKISFGLFFIHGFVAAGFAWLMQSVFIKLDSLYMLAELSTVVLMSVWLTTLIKRLLGQRSRYVIGC